jgi:hypothetical protein
LPLLHRQFFPPFYAFFLQRLAFPFNRHTSRAAETRCPSPSSNTEFPTSTVHKSLFRPLFPSLHPPPRRGFISTNPTIPPFIGALGISLAPITLPVQRLKAIVTVSSFPLSRLILGSPGHLSPYNFSFANVSCRQSQSSDSTCSCFFHRHSGLLRLASS